MDGESLMLRYQTYMELQVYIFAVMELADRVTRCPLDPLSAVHSGETVADFIADYADCIAGYSRTFLNLATRFSTV